MHIEYTDEEDAYGFPVPKNPYPAKVNGVYGHIPGAQLTGGGTAVWAHEIIAHAGFDPKDKSFEVLATADKGGELKVASTNIRILYTHQYYTFVVKKKAQPHPDLIKYNLRWV